MIRRRLHLCLLVCFFGSLVFLGRTGAQTPHSLRPQAQTITPAAFAAGGSQGITSGADGVAPTGPTAVATTAVTAAPAPFTYVMLRWDATTPLSATVAFEARASDSGRTWTSWGSLPENDDLLQQGDSSTLHWSSVVYAGPSRFWQLRVTLATAPDGSAPVVHQAQLYTVDATASTNPVGHPVSAAPDGSISRPTFVSRADWGGSEVLNNSVAPEWYPANHLVVHHTADANSLGSRESSWAARVRAEWAFHTYPSGRGWGDIGYNWLIDPNGVIYEGRNGSSSFDQDSVGFHDTANYGSMGVALLGTFGSGVPDVPPITPTAAAQDALVRLLAWKASQRNIDPLGQSFYYGCSISTYCQPYNAGSVVANIAGHRQVTPGHTTCPGDLAVNILDSIRHRVHDAIGGAPDNGDSIIDDLEAGFERSPNSWHEDGCGFGGHTSWTYATDGAVENWGRWRPNLPQSGRYHLYAARPQGCSSTAGQAVTTHATYHIQYANGSTTVTRSQDTGDDWIDLGTYQFNAGTAGNVSLDDATGEPYSTRRVIFFDAVKWVYEPNVTLAELSNVQVASTGVNAGAAVQVRFTIRNTGTTPLDTQGPPSGKTNDIAPGYVYDETECFDGNAGHTYPRFPKETGRLRIALGATENGRALGADCSSDEGGFPWRWGTGGTLQPGESRTVVGYVRFSNVTAQPRSITLHPSLVNEYVQFYSTGASDISITINPEHSVPQVSASDSAGQPLAGIYRLVLSTQSLLQRSPDPLSIQEGDFLGAFPWDGTAQPWGIGGPNGQTEQFIVRQARPFVATQTGMYTFETTTDDGSWLWVDGQLVVSNEGLHAVTSVSGSVWLAAGTHALGFKYLEWYGDAYARYSWMPPGTTTFSTIPVLQTLGAPQRGTVFGAGQQIAIAADDLGGLGINAIKYTVDGGAGQYANGPTVVLSLGDGVHQITYSSMDRGGNWSPVSALTVTVDTTPPVTTLSTSTDSNGIIWLNWTSSPDATIFELLCLDSTTQAWTSLGRPASNPLAFFGVPGHQYQFQIHAFDGLNWENWHDAATPPSAVPSWAHFYHQYLLFDGP